MNIIEELKKRGLRVTPENIDAIYKENFVKEYNENIQKVKFLLETGMSKRDILLLEEYSFDVLNEAGVGITALTPLKEPQNVIEDWSYSIPNDGKFEYYNDTCFGDALGRDSLALCLLANMGLEHFVNILPEESKKILIDILKK